MEEHPRIATGRLLHWRDHGALSPEAFERAIDWATAPRGRERWSLFLGRWLLILGLALLTAGVLFFMAYNWAELSRFQKLGLVQLLLVAAVVGAGTRGVDSLVGQVLWSSASVLVGVLLAVYGQVYQTGADAYTLFLGWGLLTLPWCLAARSNFQWLLQAILANTTFILWWEQTLDGDFAVFAALYLLLNLGLSLLWQHQLTGREWMQPELATALLINGLTPITLASCWALWEGEWYLLDLVLTLAALAILVKRHKDSMALMTAVAASALTIGAAFLVRLFIEWDLFGFLLVALGILAEVALAVRWLKSLRRPPSAAPVEVDTDDEEVSSPSLLHQFREALSQEQLLSPEQAESLATFEEDVPWYVKAVTGMGAWVASWFFIGFFVALVSDSEGVVMTLGALLCLATIGLRRSPLAHTSDFWQQVSLSAHLAGQLMVVITFAFESESVFATGMLLLVLETVCIFFYPDIVGRFLFTNAAVLGAGLCLGEAGEKAGWELLVTGLALALTALWFDSGRFLKSRWGRLHAPVTMGLVTAFFGVLLAAALSGDWFMQSGPLSVLVFTSLTVVLSYLLGAPMLALVGLGLLGALTWTVPGLMAALLVMMLSFHAGNRGGQAIALAALAAFGSFFYYSLELTFVLKSATLVASGALLLMIRGVVHRAS